LGDHRKHPHPHVRFEFFNGGTGSLMCTVLVVEDDPDIRELLTLELRDLGHEVTTSEHGREGFEWLAGPAGESCCIVLLDLFMPVMDGWDFLYSLRQYPAWTELPVIVLSASVTADAPFPVLPAQAYWSKAQALECLETIPTYCRRHGTT